MSTNQLNTEVIKEVFKSMKYKTGEENAVEKMDNIFKDQSADELNEFLTQFAKKNEWGSLKNEARKSLINKLATEIENNVDIYVALEQKVRKISSSYTKQKSVPYLVATLRYFADFCELVERKQKDILLSKLSENSSLSLLGYIFGPTLAAGYRLLIITSNGLGNVLKLLEQTMTLIGFPEGTISVLSNEVDLDIVLKYSSIVCLTTTTNKRISQNISAVLPLSTPVIVFDNADLDSACEAIFNVTWKNQMLFDSTAKEILVQETIYEKFVGKLKEKILADERDNSGISDNSLVSLIEKARKNGIEIFPPISGDECTGKIMFIGGKIFDKNTLIAPCLSVAAFRSVNEAIALANNNCQGLSASVWTENIGIGNYVAQKLDVSNIWINSFDIYSPDVAFIPRKLSGKGPFGGIQSFNELIYRKDTEGECLKKEDESEKKLCTLFMNQITTAKKNHQSWSSLPRYTRINKLSTAIQHIENIKNKFRSIEVIDEWLNQWKTLFYAYIEAHYDFSISSPVKGYNLNVSYSPRGVLVAETTDTLEQHNKKLIIASILEGNNLIVLNHCAQADDFYNELSKQLPPGVLSVVPFFNMASTVALKISEIDGYFNVYNGATVGLECNKLTMASSSWSDIHCKVTYVKNVWSNIG